jgi:deoxyxylulose-5-phosphate synthase
LWLSISSSCNILNDAVPISSGVLSFPIHKCAFISSNEINNLNVGIVGVSILNKIDEEFIKNLKPKSTLYVYEDVIYPGSLASIILKYVNDHNLCIKVKSLCIDSTYIKCGKVRELKEEYKISINDLINLINKNNK